MKNLATSMIRLPWSLSMLSLVQAANMMNTREGWATISSTLDSVSSAAEGGMIEPVRGFYRTGDQMQTAMIDAAVDLTCGSWSDPRGAVRRAWESLGRCWSNPMAGGA